MGIRPTVAFVCGIDDAKRNDPRYKHPGFNIWDAVLPEDELFLDKPPDKEIYMSEVYILENTEHKPPFVAGYVISRADEDFSRALDVCFGWSTDDKVFTLPYKPNPSEFMQKQYAMRDGDDNVSIITQEHRWLGTYTPFYVNLYLRRALFVLQYAGWISVTRDMLKFMIVSYWN